jgi:PAS domain S-box-containing protein/putative nucleotidyltransferase with HDIG domain
MKQNSITILLIEDNPGYIDFIDRMISKVKDVHLVIKHVESLEKGLAYLDSNRYDAILLSLMLPDSTGLTTFLKIYHHTPETPIVILSTITNQEAAIKAVKEGAQDYLQKSELTPGLLVRSLFYAIERKHVEEALRQSEVRYREHVENIGDIVYLLDQKRNFKYTNKSLESLTGRSISSLMGKNFNEILAAHSHQKMKKITARQLRGENIGTFELEIMGKDGQRQFFETRERLNREKNQIIEIYGIGRNINERKQVERELIETISQLEKTIDGIVKALSIAIESRDSYTAGHQERVSQLATAIASEMELDREEVETIRLAGNLHDIGKIHLPSDILNKPGKLMDIDTHYIKSHPQIGYEILKMIPFKTPVAKIVLQHHEFLDGSGYPYGIMGNDILMGARIIAVADAMEAMITHRPYRPSLGVEKALSELVRYSGIRYDSRVVSTCNKLFKEKKFEFDELILDSSITDKSTSPLLKQVEF